VALALLLTAAPLAAQSPVMVSGTEQFTLTSRHNGVTYRIDAWLPPGLDTMTSRPPVFVVTDGNMAFHQVHQTFDMLALAGEVSPLIIIGVSYPETDGRGYTAGYMAHRMRDYTPTNLAANPGGGGAHAFLAFLKDELLPTVESRWRADPTRRGLGGHSLGGLFASYALLHEPTLFSRYWIGSPSLWWDAPLAFTWVDSARSGAAKPRGRAFLTVGDQESDVMVPPMRRMAAALAGAFPTLHVGSQVYPEESHTSVVGPAISRALRFLYGQYGRPAIPLTPVQRNEYVGDWTAGDLTVRVRPAAGGLTLSMTTLGISVGDRLRAAARDTLFSAGTIVSEFVAIRDRSGALVALRGTLMGQTQDFRRTATRRGQ
jgi:predicted alpha/beta superfamily hydrolase